MTPAAARPVLELSGVRVTLRPPRAGDADAARCIGVHPEVVSGFGEDLDHWRETTAAEDAAFAASLAAAPDKVEWALETGGAFIGTARLHSFDDAQQSAAYAIGILAPEHLGRGYGTEVTRAVLEYAFADLGLRSATVRVLDVNARAIACYAKCGFVFERRETRVLELRGRWCDDVMMRLEADRFRLLQSTWGAVLE